MPSLGAEGSQPRSSARTRHTNLTSAQQFLAARASEPQNFTLRGVLVGLAIGVVICFSNTYFGLQTGWVSGMTMPSALIGFAFFKSVSRWISYPFTPVENVLVQTVAGSVGTMPLGCGFVGVIPALEFLLKPEEGGPLGLSLGKLIIWAVGICFFGVVFAVPLRREVIIREKLKFPSGTATALMIGVLHGDEKDVGLMKDVSGTTSLGTAADEERERLVASDGTAQEDPSSLSYTETATDDRQSGWKARIRLLIISFACSAVYVRTLSPIIIFRCILFAHASFRLSSPTSFLNSATSPSSASLWHQNGSGPSTLLQPTSLRASLWVPQPPSTCCSALS